MQVVEGDKEEKLGKLMLVVDKESAIKFAQFLEDEVYETGRPEVDYLTEHDESALKETANILTGACLAAMTGWVDLELKEGIPDIKTDMLRATLDEILADMSRQVDEVLLFKTDFNFEEEINANFLFLFQPEGENQILQKMEV